MLVKQRTPYLEAIQWTDPLDKSSGVTVIRTRWATPKDTEFVVTEDSKKSGKKGLVVQAVVVDPATGSSKNININDWIIRDKDTKAIHRVISDVEFKAQYQEANSTEFFQDLNDKLQALIQASIASSLPLVASEQTPSNIKGQILLKVAEELNMVS